MRTIINVFILLFSLCLLIVSCTPDANQDLIDHSTDEHYYQLGDIGTYWEYQLDSLIFDNQGATQLNRTGFQRNEIVNVEGSANGDTTFTMQLKSRATLDDSWNDEKLYTVEKNLAGEIFVNIDNLIFKEFSFPFSEGTSWDNIFFDPVALELIEVVEGEVLERYRDWDQATVMNRDTTLLLSGTTYESVATVQEVSSDNNVDIRKSIAYYSNGVGLILRERSVLHTQCLTPNPLCEFDPWEEKAEKGYIVSQTLLAHSIQ